MTKPFAQMSSMEQATFLLTKIEEWRGRDPASTMYPLPWWVTPDAVSILLNRLPDSSTYRIGGTQYIKFPPRPH